VFWGFDEEKAMSEIELEEQLIPQKSRDKLVISLFISGMVRWIVAFFPERRSSFSLQRSNLNDHRDRIHDHKFELDCRFEARDVQIKYSALCLVSIGLRLSL